MKYRVISIISVFSLLIALALGFPGMNLEDSNMREKTGSVSVDTYAEATGQEDLELTGEEEGDEEDGQDDQTDQNDTDLDTATDGDDQKDPTQTDTAQTGSGSDNDTAGQTVTDTKTESDAGSADQQTTDDAAADKPKTEDGSTGKADSGSASKPEKKVTQPPVRPGKNTGRQAPRKVNPIDTKKTDSQTDAAPKNLDLKITDQDRTAVLNTPNTPIDASEVSGSRVREDGKYEAFLETEYGVVFSADFALIMEEIENLFELKHGLISEKAYRQRAENLEKGVVFGLDESSARAKPECENEFVVFSDEEVELYSDESAESPDIDGKELVATYHYTNWADILAVYIWRQKQAGADKVLLNEHAAEALAQLFADMNEVEITDEENLVAQFTCRTAEEMLSDKAEDDPSREEIARYLDPAFITICAAQSGSRQLTLAAIRASEQAENAEAEDVSQEQPFDARRESVILAAQTLNGKIHYFWGGKYNNIGWNKHWCTLRPVVSAGSRDTGSYQMYGLDCSGFVSWSFINGFDSREAHMRMGEGTASQWATSEPVSDEEARIGDLVFLRAPSAGGINHVGILIGRDADGNWLAIHCNGGDDNVSVDRAYDAGFRYIRRPVIYED